VWRATEDSGKEIVAPFHIHRRHPANFSLIDYRLHNPGFAWHLILSLRDPKQPALRAFRVCKDAAEFGITAQDGGQGSELPYHGPEVTELAVIADGAATALRRLATILALTPNGSQTRACRAGTAHRPERIGAAGRHAD
jgi:hypothetical protein